MMEPFVGNYLDRSSIASGLTCRSCGERFGGTNSLLQRIFYISLSLSLCLRGASGVPVFPTPTAHTGLQTLGSWQPSIPQFHQAVEVPNAAAYDNLLFNFVKTFGYRRDLIETDSPAEALTHWDKTHDIRRIQENAGLPVSGVLDLATLKLIQTPRCGVSDAVDDVGDDAASFPWRAGGGVGRGRAGRRKRWTIVGPAWNTTELYWRLDSAVGPFNTPEKYDSYKRAIERAFDLWELSSNLRFSESVEGYPGDVTDPRPHIRLGFYKNNHNDNYAFDGNGGILAHAFYPGYDDPDGQVHFDADELWAVQDTGGAHRDLFSTVVHELGHALGLGHSKLQGSVMYAWDRGFREDFRLHEDDINGIQQLYGGEGTTGSIYHRNKLTSPTTTPIPVTTVTPMNATICDTSFDAVFIRKSMIHFFRDNVNWLMHSSVSDGAHIFWYGEKNHLSWQRHDEPPTFHVDAAVYIELYHATWLFEGKSLHAFDGGSYYGTLTLEDIGLTGETHVDAAFAWDEDRIFLMTGDHYYRLNGTTLKPPQSYPRAFDVWKGVPANLDAAVQLPWESDYVYFLKGSLSYKFDKRQFQVIEVVPIHDMPLLEDHCRQIHEATSHVSPGMRRELEHTGGIHQGNGATSLARFASSWLFTSVAALAHVLISFIRV